MPTKSTIEFKTTPCGTTSIQVTSPENLRRQHAYLTHKQQANKNLQAEANPSFLKNVNVAMSTTSHQHRLAKVQYLTLNQATFTKKNLKTEILVPRRWNVVCTSRRSIETEIKHFSSITYEHS